MGKDFDKWNEKKKRLHATTHRPVFVSQREIWWCSLGVNVGREQDGRGDNFERPVVVLRRMSPDTFMALPLSSKKRLEKFQSPITHGEIYGFALLDQIRVLDSKRLRRKVGTISRDEFEEIENRLREFL